MSQGHKLGFSQGSLEGSGGVFSMIATGILLSLSIVELGLLQMRGACGKEKE